MRHPGVLKSLVEFRDAEWLRNQRRRFIIRSGANVGRNTLDAGRTGTRCIGSKPQMRWEAGVTLARSVIRAHENLVFDPKPLGVRIRDALNHFSDLIFRPP